MTTPRFNPPQQSRSQETLDRLLDATEAVLEEKSFGEATLAEIVERAGLTVGAFYRRFPDKDALLHHLDERFFADMHARASGFLDPGRWEGIGTADLLRAVANEAVAVYSARRGLLRSLFLRARVDPVIQETARAVNAEFVARLRALLRPRAADLTHPDPDRAAELGFMMLVGAVRETVLFGEVWPDGGAAGAPDLPAELGRLLVGYFGATR